MNPLELELKPLLDCWQVGRLPGAGCVATSSWLAPVGSLTRSRPPELPLVDWLAASLLLLLLLWPASCKDWRWFTPSNGGFGFLGPRSCCTASRFEDHQRRHHHHHHY